MKIVLLTCMIALVAFAEPSFAQSNSMDIESLPSTQSTAVGGPSANERESGETGWSGGSRGQVAKTGDGPTRFDLESAANQPEMATGKISKDRRNNFQRDRLRNSLRRLLSGRSCAAEFVSVYAERR